MNILIYGSPDASPDLFHEIPTGIIDPFLYLEANGKRGATVTVLDQHKVSPYGIEILDPYDLGADELFSRGISRYEVDLELARRACEEMGVGKALIPPEFPVGLADHLRASGIELFVDPEVFVTKRRVKTQTEVEGIRRAQRAADEAMAVGARMIRDGGSTSEAVREAMQAVCDEHGCDLPDDVIVAHGTQSAVGHEAGHGPIGEGEVVIVDIWPRDRQSRCWADMTRTFIAGGMEPPDELAEYWRLTRESTARSPRSARAPTASRSSRSPASRSRTRATRRSARSRRAPSSTRATTTRSATASGSRSTSGRTSAARPTRCSRATSSRWSPAATASSWAACASRTSCSCTRTAPSCSRIFRTISRRFRRASPLACGR
jgi:Xaa-Pro aminopeptidase